MRGALLIAVACVLGGCPDEDLAQLDRIKTELCACKTIACGQAAMKKVPQRDGQANHRSQKIAKEMLECLARLYETDRPTTDPDAPEPEPEPEPPATSPGSAAPASAKKR